MWITNKKPLSMKGLAAFIALSLSMGIAQAKDDFSDLYGVWQWKETGIEVNVGVCGYNPDKICAIIVKGDNKGNYVLRSIYKEDNKVIGKMIHPIDGRSYDAVIKMTKDNTVNISGCAAGKTNCQDSVWNRIKK